MESPLREIENLAKTKLPFAWIWGQVEKSLVKFNIFNLNDTHMVFVETGLQHC